MMPRCVQRDDHKPECPWSGHSQSKYQARSTHGIASVAISAQRRSGRKRVCVVSLHALRSMTIELSQSSSPVPIAMQPSLVLPRPALPARPCYGAACRPYLLAIVFAAVHCADASEEIHGNKWRHPYDMYSDTDVFLTDVPRLRSLRLSSPPFRLQ